MRPRRLSPVFASAAFLLGLAGCYDEASQAPMPNITAPPVEAVQARFGGLPLVERLSGTVRAENQVSLYPEFSGRIAATSSTVIASLRKTRTSAPSSPRY